MDKALVCEDCGTEEDVKETVCPFKAEIYNEEVPATLCKECAYQRFLDT